MDHLNIPDFSCEIDKPLSYLGHICEHFSRSINYEENGTMVLDESTAKAFGWMIGDSLNVIRDMQKGLYPESTTSST